MQLLSKKLNHNWKTKIEVETVEIKDADSPQTPQEQIQEKPQMTEESPPVEKTEGWEDKNFPFFFYKLL